MLTREIVGRTFGQNWHYLDLQSERSNFFWHYHPEFELTLTRRGNGLRYIGSDVAPFGEVDLALVAANQPHTWDTTPREDGQIQHIQVIFFTREWLEGLAIGALPELTGFLSWLNGVRQGVVFSEACIRQILPAFDRLHSSRELLRLSSLLEILDALPRDSDARHLGKRGVMENNDKRLETALRFIQENYRSSISLEKIAEVATTSEATLKRLFRQHLKLSITDLLIHLRISHACSLLIAGDLPIQLVAEESGFPNPSHFYRQFKLQRGVSPAQFRQRHHLRQMDKRDRPPTEGFRNEAGQPLQARPPL